MYKAIGSRNAITLPSIFANAMAVRSIPTASSPRDGQAMINPGMSRRAAMLLSL